MKKSNVHEVAELGKNIAFNTAMVCIYREVSLVTARIEEAEKRKEIIASLYNVLGDIQDALRRTTK